MTPTAIQAALQAALNHHQSGRLREAEEGYRLILSVDPNHADALYLLGSLAAHLGRAEMALGLLDRSINAQPNRSEPHHVRGTALQSLGRIDDAIAAYTQANQLPPPRVATFNNLGVLLFERGRLEAAADAYSSALRIDPNSIEALCNLGAVLHAQKRFDEATAALNRAIALKPDLADAYNNLGNVMRDQGRLHEEFAAYSKAVALRPDFAGARGNLGMVLQEMGRPREAIDEFHAALRHDPNSGEALWNLSLAYLVLGDFERGLPLYEHRWRQRDKAKQIRRFSRPTWDGSDPAGKTILVYVEQGLGDMIQFARYMPLITARGGKVILECQPELIALLQGFAGVSRLVPENQAMLSFDVHIALLSLPLAFGTRVDTIPAAVPYLAADPIRSEAWARRLGPSNGRRRIGLVWAGHPRHVNDHNRSMKFAQLAPLFAAKGIQFISLQKGAAALNEHPNGDVLDCGSTLKDFAETAALVWQLDLVISVDTAVAHLAGAMGKPVWLLLPFAPDWRWMLGRDDTPWYPTMRLFRQTAAGDWADVVRRVEEAMGI